MIHNMGRSNERVNSYGLQKLALALRKVLGVCHLVPRAAGKRTGIWHKYYGVGSLFGRRLSGAKVSQTHFCSKGMPKIYKLDSLASFKGENSAALSLFPFFLSSTTPLEACLRSRRNLRGPHKSLLLCPLRIVKGISRTLDLWSWVQELNVIMPKGVNHITHIVGVSITSLI